MLPAESPSTTSGPSGALAGTTGLAKGPSLAPASVPAATALFNTFRAWP